MIEFPALAANAWHLSCFLVYTVRGFIEFIGLLKVFYSPPPILDHFCVLIHYVLINVTWKDGNEANIRVIQFHEVILMNSLLELVVETFYHQLIFVRQLFGGIMPN